MHMDAGTKPALAQSPLQFRWVPWGWRLSIPLSALGLCYFADDREAKSGMSLARVGSRTGREAHDAAWTSEQAGGPVLETHVYVPVHPLAGERANSSSPRRMPLPFTVLWRECDRLSSERVSHEYLLDLWVSHNFTLLLGFRINMPLQCFLPPCPLLLLETSLRFQPLRAECFRWVGGPPGRPWRC